jgi:hypothetical protein
MPDERIFRMEVVIYAERRAYDGRPALTQRVKGFEIPRKSVFGDFGPCGCPDQQSFGNPRFS